MPCVYACVCVCLCLCVFVCVCACACGSKMKAVSLGSEQRREEIYEKGQSILLSRSML